MFRIVLALTLIVSTFSLYQFQIHSNFKVYECASQGTPCLPEDSVSPPLSAGCSCVYIAGCLLCLDCSLDFCIIYESHIGPIRKCGWPIPKDYDRSRQMCCNFTIHDKFTTDGVRRELKCCSKAGQVYDPVTMICCGDQLRNRTLLRGERYECCGGYKLYVLGKEGTCCGGVFHKAIVGQDVRCCGNKTYDQKRHRCCDGMKRPRRDNEECCGNIPYNISSHWCNDTKNVISKNLTCGNNTFIKGEAICCGGKIFNLSREHPVLWCCNSKAYVPRTAKCDRQQVMPLRNKWCGTVHYNHTTHFCCNNSIFSTKSGKFCCGNTLADRETQDCCIGKPFNKLNQQCCGGNVIDGAEKCCDGQRIDLQNQVCCESYFGRKRLINITDSNKRTCCRTALHDEFTQKCVNGKIYNTTAARCGENIYNKTKDLCCNSELHRGAKLRGLQCCFPGSMTFNPTNQSCCNSVVENRNRCTGPNRRRLQPKCGRSPYNKETDKCCNAKLYVNATVQGLQCCPPGYKIYNPKNQTCCNGAVRNGTRCRIHRHANNCNNICLSSKHKRILKKFACKKYTYIIKKKKTRKSQNKQIFRIQKDLFTKRRIKVKKTVQLYGGLNCSCINENSRFVIMTDIFPKRKTQVISVLPYSRSIRRILKRLKRKCKS